MMKRTARKNDEIVASTQERLQESFVSTGRPNINEINKRNAEQDKQEKKASYKVAGTAILAIVLIVIAVYVFS